MHAILRGSESCDCNKDKYDIQNACAYGSVRTTALRIRHQLSRRAAQRSQLLHSEVWSLLATTPQCSFTKGYRQSEKKQRNCDRRAICDTTSGIGTGRGVICRRGVSDGSDGARPLWRSHSAQTEMFFADVTLQIIFDAWWASMHVGSKRPIHWNNSRHAHSWRFYWHCGIQETSSPGIKCIVCYQVVRHPSEHGTRSMGKHLLAKAHIAKLNKSTESEVTELSSSMVDETALAILKR